jgi:hypothetical protein
MTVLPFFLLGFAVLEMTLAALHTEFCNPFRHWKTTTNINALSGIRTHNYGIQVIMAYVQGRQSNEYTEG